MPTKPKQHPKYKNVWLQHWTRKEQIANAKADGTLKEMRPPL